MTIEEADRWAAGKYFKLEDGEECEVIRVGDVDMVSVAFKDDPPKTKARAYFFVLDMGVVQQFDMSQQAYRELRKVEKALEGSRVKLRVDRKGVGPKTKYFFKSLGAAGADADTADKEFGFFEKELPVGKDPTEAFDEAPM